MAQLWYSENMELILNEDKNMTIYSEAQTQKKYAVWCSCFYFFDQKRKMKFL